jgi:hypothetical protein
MFPSVINVRIETGSRFRLRLWLPVILLWPFLPVFVLLLLPFLAMAELILRATGARIYPFRMLCGLWAVCWSLGGTMVKVRSIRQNSIVNVTMH